MVPHGAVGIYWDPHEVCNVLGIEGVRLMAKDAARTPLKAVIAASSCVPAVPGFEDTGASVDVEDVAETMGWETVAGLGEMMNFPGILDGADADFGVVAPGRCADVVLMDDLDRCHATNVFIDGEDMALAANTLIESGGGSVVVAGGQVLGHVPLPVARLMSTLPVELVAEQVEQEERAWEQIGCTLPSPFMTMAFVSLACLPQLRQTNRGLVDCRTFEFVDPFVEGGSA